MLKYLGHAEGSNRYYDSDVIIFRFSDAVLMMAEVENGLGNQAAAANYINQIRQRAYRGVNPPMFPVSDFATTELAILRERDKEFVGEGSRWFDLIRMHDAAGQPLAFSAQPVAVTAGCQLTDDPLMNLTSIASLPAGRTVTYLTTVINQNGQVWDYVETTVNSQTVRGYVPSGCLAVPADPLPDLDAYYNGDQ